MPRLIAKRPEQIVQEVRESGRTSVDKSGARQYNSSKVLRLCDRTPKPYHHPYFLIKFYQPNCLSINRHGRRTMGTVTAKDDSLFRTGTLTGKSLVRPGQDPAGRDIRERKTSRCPPGGLNHLPSRQTATHGGCRQANSVVAHASNVGAPRHEKWSWMSNFPNALPSKGSGPPWYFVSEH